jgi:hypothetical protein
MCIFKCPANCVSADHRHPNNLFYFIFYIINYYFGAHMTFGGQPTFKSADTFKKSRIQHFVHN